jgi:hypothetical protein
VSREEKEKENYQLANQSMGLIGRIEVKPIGVRYES